ncbi:sulfotransferase 1C4-like isoform X2 [Protopterus annectens]|uniref:sulfotransferase 1C4-like isoform X2 n=1 Tax=Protopterus annectens TaxID=7888 RepID=UPI001CF968AB|nr:sulfotransferase 1C4-like isoform X2 [Protopterus annectens]
MSATVYDFQGLKLDNFERLKLRPVEGIPLIETTADTWDQVKTFQAKSDDLLIATYPRAGTTWMQEIVDMINNKGNIEKCIRGPMHDRFPFIEIVPLPPSPSGVKHAEQMQSPRIIKTHLPFQLIPKSFLEEKCKIIYVARNAKDNAVSYYHFHQMNRGLPEPGTWEEFLKKFQEGTLCWGSWYAHVQGWWDAKDHHNILYIFYEDIKESPRREIQRVMQFLNADLPDNILEKIYQHTSFEFMKKNPMTNYSTIPPPIFDHTISAFMRKGIVGGWKDSFSPSQNEAFDKDYMRKMAKSYLMFKWEL